MFIRSLVSVAIFANILMFILLLSLVVLAKNNFDLLNYTDSNLFLIKLKIFITCLIVCFIAIIWHFLVYSSYYLLCVVYLNKDFYNSIGIYFIVGSGIIWFVIYALLVFYIYFFGYYLTEPNIIWLADSIGNIETHFLVLSYPLEWFLTVLGLILKFVIAFLRVHFILNSLNLPKFTKDLFILEEISTEKGFALFKNVLNHFLGVLIIGLLISISLNGVLHYLGVLKFRYYYEHNTAELLGLYNKILDLQFYSILYISTGYLTRLFVFNSVVLGKLNLDWINLVKQKLPTIINYSYIQLPILLDLFVRLTLPIAFYSLFMSGLMLVLFIFSFIYQI